MKNILTILLICCIGCSKGQTYNMGLISTNRDTVPFFGKNIVFIGNSIVQGFGVSASDKFTTVFTTAKGGVEVNMGISGQVLEIGGTCGNTFFDRNTIPFYSSSYAAIFICLGVNDLGLNTPAFTSARYGLTLDSVVSFSINSRNWPHQRIVIVTPFWFTNYAIYDTYTGCGHVTSDATVHAAYVASATSVANSRGCTLADIYTAMNNSPSKGTFLQADGLHPNTTGHAFIASFIGALTYYQR
jgi:lysophospholipase L1-like esterase